MTTARANTTTWCGDKALEKRREAAAKEEQAQKDKGIVPKAKDGKDKPRTDSIEAFANLLKELIDAIETDKNPPKLISIMNQ